VASVFGCNHLKTVHDSCHISLIKELIKNDVLVFTTGCAAMACGKAGLLIPRLQQSLQVEGLQRSARQLVSHLSSI
jgi:carbon-monoxide dehydrogenase catalytic subunit